MYSAVGFSEWFAQKMATLKRGLGGSKLDSSTSKKHLARFHTKTVCMQVVIVGVGWNRRQSGGPPVIVVLAGNRLTARAIWETHDLLRFRNELEDRSLASSGPHRWSA